LKSQSLQELCSRGGELYDEISIPAEIARHDRVSLFQVSVAAFQAHGSAADANSTESRPPPADLIHALEAGNDYHSPLAVQMAALLHVRGIDAERGHGIAHLLDLILGLEYDRWDKTLKSAGQPNWQAAVKNGVAQTTLVGGVEGGQAAEALIGRDALFRDARDIDVPRVRAALSAILPGAN